MSPTCEGAYSYTVRPGDTLWRIANRFHTTMQEIAAMNPGMDVYNLYIGQIICIPQRNGRTPAQNPARGISKSELALSNHLRLLWEQHVYWTRLFILSTAFSLPDTQFVTDRLLRNPKDFEAALRPLYGESIAAKLEELLTSHLTIAAELVSAAKSGDSAAADDAEARWYANADQIAIFLGSINPYWSAQEWQRALYDHLAMTKTETVNILTGQYADSISVFDNIELQALSMADMMTRGIVRQFPQQFR